MDSVSELNLAALNEVIAEAVSERDAIVFRDRRISYGDFNIRTRQLANVLLSAGLGCHQERDTLHDWQSGQDHVGLYLYNGNEYLEAMVASYKSRTVPFNVNFRYVDDELTYLLNNARTSALIYHASLAERVSSISEHVPSLRLLIQVNDDSDVPLLEGALDYETALSKASDERPDLE